MFRLNKYTHKIVAPDGKTVARFRLGKGTGFAIDTGNGRIARTGGPSLHDAIMMAGYKKDSYPAASIAGELHFMTGKTFAGHTIVKES